MNLRVIVVDDEFPAREELKAILRDIGAIDIVGECEDGDEVLDMVQEQNPDVVFMDIQMRNKDGLVTAGEILELNYPPRIVFTSGFNQFAAKAFELNAVDYILKPYSLARVQKSVEKLRPPETVTTRKPLVVENMEFSQIMRSSLCVWGSDRMIMLRASEVFFAKADKYRQTLLETEQGQLFTKMTLRDLEGLFKEQGFLRIHKSYLVNLAKVREVIPWFNNTYVLTLENCRETNIPVARHYIKEFNRVMGIKL
ncbi:MAG: LytTR family DNA-binding domain-containing protein [Sporomusaceae bacterium]|nr:LytTR family DNA-binding domain-containing protein [Sporomusaceae bacterium]